MPTTADLGALFRLHVQFVARSLRRLGVPASDIDDGVQEVFVVASRKLASIEAGAERAFLYGTATRVASNARRGGIRAQARIDAVSPPNPGEEPATPSAEVLFEQHSARAMLDAVLETMSEGMRQVFTLFELEEMSTSEIAELLGVPPGTVSSRLSRARKHFEHQVELLRRHEARALSITKKESEP